MPSHSSSFLRAPRTVWTVAVASVLALLAALVVPLARPAAAAPPCDPWSPLDCSDVAVDLPVSLSFDGTQGGIATGAGAGTGFTLRQPSTKGGTLQPSLLALDAGTLRVTTTQGIQYKDVNNLDNALGVGVDAAGSGLEVSTTVVRPPAGTNKAEQGGIWFGPTEDDYVKLVVGSQPGGAARVQLAREVGAVSNGTTDEVNTQVGVVSASEVRLVLTVEPGTGGTATATAQYAVGSGALQDAGSLTVPAGWTDGTAAGFPQVDGVTAATGLFATSRNSTSALTYAFRGFEVSSTDTGADVPPSAPASLSATGEVDSVSLAWDAVTADDLAGYSVFRGEGSTAPATDGQPLSGTDPVTATSYTDATAVGGSTYTYAVVAVDAAGNRSEPVTATATALQATDPDPDPDPDPQPEPQPEPDTTAPAAPTGLTATVDGGDVDLSWTAPADDDVAGYRVHGAAASPVTTDGAALSGAEPVAATSFTDTTLAAGESRTYAVVAVDAAGNVSDASGEATAQVPADPGPADPGPADPGPGPDPGPGDPPPPADVTCTAPQWRTEYFTGVELAGEPDVVRCEDRVGADYGTGAPAGTDLPADGFSGRWTQTAQYAGGDVRLTARSDDGVRVLVDGELVIDGWGDHGPETFTATRSLAQGEHTVVVEYYERTGGATLSLLVEPLGSGGEPQTCDAGQWSVEYFANAGLTGAPATTRCEDVVGADYGDDAPAGTDLPADGFSGRWTADREFSAGTWTFTTTSDDGVRVLVDGELLIDGFFDHGPETFTATRQLTEGTHRVVVEYYERTGGAQLSFSFAGDSTGQQCPEGSWAASWYDGTRLVGTPVTERCEDALDFAFGSGGPEGIPSVGTDTFAGRFTQTRTTAAGEHTFTVTSDDGVRVRVDGDVVIDRFYDHGAETYTATRTLPAGEHTVVVEYYERTGDAVLQAAWASPSDGEPTVCDSGYRAQYFSGTGLSGTPLLERCEDAIAYSYGAGGPQGTALTDNFSARWTQTRTFTEGEYTFRVTSDDGVRVLVDGTPVVDAFYDHGPETFTGTRQLTAGEHTVVVEYYERTGDATIALQVSGGTPAATCEPDQYLAEYYDGTALAGSPAATRCEDAVDYSFGSGGVDGVPSVGTDTFSARWTTRPVLAAGDWTFRVTSDDGVRVRVDGTTILDRFFNHGPETYEATVPLSAGEHVVVVEYYEDRGDATARFSYEPAGGTVDAPPAAPTALSATAGDASVQLGWTAPADADLAGYRVYRGEGTGAVATTGAPLSGDALVTTSAYTDTTAANGTTYSYVVVAVDTAGQASEASGPATATPVAPEPDPEPVELRLNFQPAAAPVPAGYTAQTGSAYSEAAGSGWVRQDSLSAPTATPLDLGKNTRDRNRAGVEQRRDTMIHLQYGDIANANPNNGVGTAGAFEAAVPNGTYAVTVSVGDQPGTTGYDSTHTLRAEGVTLVDGFVATAQQEYLEATGTVTVTDGRLSVDAVGGTNTKLNYLEVRTSAPDTEAPAAPQGVAAAAGDGSVALSWTAGTEADLAGYRVYRAEGPGPVAASGTPVSGGALVAGPAFTDTTVTNGTTYSYVVVAVDASGNASPASAQATATPEASALLDVAVNFSDEAGAVPAGYLKDFGQAFGARTGAGQGEGLTYGWVTPGTSTPLSLVGNGRTRARTGVEPRLNTIMHAQYGDTGGTNGVAATGAWELAVANGTYEVTVAVGDEPSSTSGYDSTHAVDVENGVLVEAFQGTAAQEYRTATAVTSVTDGRLTLSPVGGTNTKLAYVEVAEQQPTPAVTTVLPANRSTGASTVDGVSAGIEVPGAGVGVDPTTLQGNVGLFEVQGGAEVPGTTGSSGGNDVIAFSPNSSLKPATDYRFVVTDAVRSEDGTPFAPFTSVFTTGDGTVVAPEDFTPVTGVSFEKSKQAVGDGKYIASMQFGPDGKLYASTIGQGIFRWTVAADGSLSDEESLGLQGRAVIGLVFDEAATPENPVAWVTHSTAETENESAVWGSKVSRLSGPSLGTVTDVFVDLPRSKKDHLTNSMAYGPDGALYFLQGSNQAAGDPDGSWGPRGEKLLTAAVLRFDPSDPQVQATLATGGSPIDVRTSDGGSYDPYAGGAPLTLYATGIRNAYDLVWHRNGHLYVPTNGTAPGGNSPGVTRNGGTLSRTGQVPGDVTSICANRRIDGRPYTGPDVPAVTNHPLQRDFLFDVEEGGYYGHPNPERCEWVLNNGSNAEGAGQGGAKYPAGTAPDPNYRGFAYDFEFNKSPNGAIEYSGSAFGGQLDGRLLVVRFSNNNDILFMQVDSRTGEVLGAQASTGITGVPGSTIGGVDGFDDPLEVVQNPVTGDLYVNQYDRGGDQQGLFLLRVPTDQQPSALAASADELVFSAPKGTTDGPEQVTLSNTGTSDVTVTTSVTGPDAGAFSPAVSSLTVPAGGSATLGVGFAPGTRTGSLSATLRLAGGDTTIDVGLYGLAPPGQFGGNEPTFAQVLSTLGIGVDPGWTNLAGGMQPTAKGDEVLEPLFERAGTGPVSMTPVAAYAPMEVLPFGWYTSDGTLNEVGALANGQQQTLYPTLTRGGTSFDPGSSPFGLYYFSNTFDRTGYTEDSRNDSGGAHRARVYPFADRAGNRVANSYLVAFEDASNGDYQDYVFVVRNVKPAGSGPVDPPTEPPTTTDAVRVNFSSPSGPAVDGYLRDFGQAYGARTGAGQGSGLTYGWLDQGTENPIDLASEGTTPGNGRARGVAADPRLDSFVHMQAGDIVADGNPTTFNGRAENGYWQLALPSGTYEVTVAVGDPSANDLTQDPERHTITLEGSTLIDGFVPSGAAGAPSRHATATSTVDVTDGALTVAANGGENTKIDYVEVVPVGTGDPGEGTAQVTFQPDGFATPDGWAADTGLGYADSRGYGWVTPGSSTPLARTDSMRARTSPAGDPTLRTFSIMQNDAVATLSNGSWEYALPNGTYTVSLSVGDADFGNSRHSVTAEGQNVVSEYVPTGPGDFETGTRTVDVTDGRLTLDVGFNGANTKLNWVTIAGEGLAGDADRIDPSLTAEVSGEQRPDGAYSTSATITASATDAGGSGLAGITVALDGGPAAPYGEPVVVTEPGAHTAVVTATDGAGNTTTRTLEFSVVAVVLGDGELTLTNPEAAPFDDRLVMSFLRDPRAKLTGGSAEPDGKSSSTATVRVGNDGTEAMVVDALDVSGSAFTLVQPPPLPVTVDPGGSLSLKVQFAPTVTTNVANRLFTETLSISSDAANGPTTPVELAGMYQRETEAGTEPDIVQIAETFGWGTTVRGPGQQLNNRGRVTTIGDEVLSPYWRRLDTTAPVQVRQLAAYHSCCNNSASFFWHAKGSSSTSNVLTHNGQWAQTLLPRKGGSTSTTPAVSTFSPGVPVFGFKIDPEWSDPDKNNISPDKCTASSPSGVEEPGCQLGHHLRVWPVEDRDGVAVPGAYFVVMDYAGINYDFNDNAYLVTNITPEQQQ